MTMTEQDVTRAVAMVPPGRRLSAREREALEERGWRYTEVADPVLAFAELALRERAQRARAAWGLPRAERIVLVIIEPPAHRETAPLLEALSRYFNAVEVWACALARLSPLEHRTLATPSRRRLPPLSSPGTQAARHEGDTTTEQNRHPTQTEREGASDREDHVEAASISRDELDMLLEVTGDRKRS